MPKQQVQRIIDSKQTATPDITPTLITIGDGRYVPLADYDDGDVLNKLKNVDGAASGLDADLLDGNHAGAFAASAHTHAGGDVTSAVANATNADTLDGSHAAAFAAAAHNHTGTYAPAAHTHAGGDVTSAVANATNADTLDGSHAAAFAAASHTHATSDITNLGEFIEDQVGGMLDDTTSIDLTYTDATGKLKADIKADGVTNAMLADMAAGTIKGNITAGVANPTDIGVDDLQDWLSTGDSYSGGRTGLDADFLDGKHANDFVLASGAQVGASSQYQVFTNYIQSPFWMPSPDPGYSNADSQVFNAGTTGAPSGWTENDSAATCSQAIKPGWWFLKGTSSDTAWSYKKHLAATLSGYNRFTFGPILFRPGGLTADLTYTFAVHANNGGALDATKYVKTMLTWNNGSAVWQVSGERKDGSTITPLGAAKSLSFPTSLPIYIGIMVNPSNTVRTYVGAYQMASIHEQLGSATMALTWGQAWLQISMSRGAGGDDYLYIGRLDITDHA